MNKLIGIWYNEECVDVNPLCSIHPTAAYISVKTGNEGKYQEGKLHDAKACNTSTVLQQYKIH